MLLLHQSRPQEQPVLCQPGFLDSYGVLAVLICKLTSGASKKRTGYSGSRLAVFILFVSVFPGLSEYFELANPWVLQWLLFMKVVVLRNPLSEAAISWRGWVIRVCLRIGDPPIQTVACLIFLFFLYITPKHVPPCFVGDPRIVEFLLAFLKTQKQRGTLKRRHPYVPTNPPRTDARETSSSSSSCHGDGGSSGEERSNDASHLTPFTGSAAGL